MEELIEEYLTYLRIEKGASPRTVEAYTHDLHLYLDFLKSKGIDSPEDVAREVLVEFEQGLSKTGYVQKVQVKGKNGEKKSKPYSPTSVKRILAAVKGVHNYAVRENIAQTNPAATLILPKAADRLPDVLTIEQVNHMLENLLAPKQSDVIEYACFLRSRAILEVLYGCGLRV
ncbi:MAG: site-specific integrase, partial [Eggerthellaceae bacterium]|nr:site-specific integrase [Eggerthellaceae bacterium]